MNDVKWGNVSLVGESVARFCTTGRKLIGIYKRYSECVCLQRKVLHIFNKDMVFIISYIM